MGENLALHCAVCHGKGPMPTFRFDDRGDRIPVPFVPCPGCGLDWPAQSSPLSTTVSLVLSAVFLPVAASVAG